MSRCHPAPIAIGMLKGTRSTEECEGNFLRRFLMKRLGIKDRKDVKELCFGWQHSPGETTAVII